MTLPARLSAGMMVTTLGAVVVVALIALALNSGSKTGQGAEVTLVILLAGVPVALAVGVAGLFYGRSLTKRLRSIVENEELAAASQVNAGGDPVEALKDYVRTTSEMIGTRDALLRRSEHELRDVREQLRGVATYLEMAREGERSRIARDIHDDLGQALSTLKLDLSLLRDELGGQPEGVRDRIEGMTHLLSASIKSVKRIISELRPQVLDDLGLTAALEWQADEFQKRTGMPIELSIYPQEIILEPDQSTALFRIFQETLANVARHASAHSVRASLTEIDGVVELEVRDDGCGIRREQIEDPRSFGLLGIRERAHAWGGTVDIEGSAEEGTRVRVRFELQEDP